MAKEKEDKEKQKILKRIIEDMGALGFNQDSNIPPISINNSNPNYQYILSKYLISNNFIFLKQ